jgi:hypothetical protein
MLFPVQTRGFFGDIVGWFIRILIYDLIVTSISEIFGVSRLVALLIFLGIMIVVSVVGYVVKQRMAPRADDWR